MQLKAGNELQSGKYRIIRVLGQGGFGITYLADNTHSLAKGAPTDTNIWTVKH